MSLEDSIERVGSSRRPTGPLPEAPENRYVGAPGGERTESASRDFSVRLGELIILLAAIVGAIAGGLGISKYFGEHHYVSAYLVTYAAFRFADLLVRDRAGLGMDPVHFSKRVMYELPLLLMFFAAPFERSWYSSEPLRGLCALGLLIELVGFWLVLGARIQLWFYTPVKADEKRMTLVRNGLYRFVRHPIYLGELLVLIAWSFEYAAPITLAATLAIAGAAMRRRIDDDEAGMLAEFGDDYAAYMRVTDKVLPNLW